VSRNVDAAADGTFSVSVKAASPGEYRVTSDTVSTPATKVVVAPRVSLKAAADLASMKGAVRPVMPGTMVQIQQQSSSGRWSTVAKAELTRAGRFAAPIVVFDGTYRARVVAGNGWAVGISPKVLVE
jgi:hypothetical protein